MTKIKWTRLEAILYTICERPCFITLTTHKFYKTDEQAISSVVFNPSNAEFLLNAHLVKTLDKTIKALAHEAAHVVQGDALHNESFNQIWKDLEDKIKKEYYEYL
jgi:hypothetical protein